MKDRPNPTRSGDEPAQAATPIKNPLSASRTVTQQREKIESAFGPALQRKKRKTGPGGMPDTLSSGIERLSGFDLSHVSVNMNSPQPGNVGAEAIAQDNNIHIAPGKEQHLPHEAWHVVQQREGRVQPTTSVAGVAINDDPGLEKEADTMGQAALQRITIDEEEEDL